jgi:hypothetical protein
VVVVAELAEEAVTAAAEPVEVEPVEVGREAVARLAAGRPAAAPLVEAGPAERARTII